MSTGALSTPARKRRSILWWLAAFFFLLACLFFFQLFGPNAPIVVSPETTYITEPLRADGLPDYEKHFLDVYRRGVTPENNAAVPLLQAIFPSGFDPPEIKAIVGELRMDQVPSASDALEPVHCEANQAALWRWLAGNSPHPGVDAIAERMLDQSVWRPWTSDQMPPMSEWLSRNKEPLDLLVEASRRPRYFMPSPTLINNRRELLTSMPFPKGLGLYHACRSLLARAMWNLGEGRPMDAWRDVHALHRLSRLLSQGLMPGEPSKARDVNTLACYATATLLDHGNLTVDQARQVHRDLSQLQPLSGVVRSFEYHHRMLALDALVYADSTGDLEQLGELDEGLGMMVELMGSKTSIDWNIVLRETNRGYDRLASAARLEDRTVRIKALAAIETDLRAQLASKINTPGDFVTRTFSRHERSELFANLILSGLLSSLKWGFAAEDRANAKLEVTRVAAALALYRAEHDRYPEKLDDLVPGIMKELPRDLFHGKPYVYKAEGQSFLLYSMGENGVDDGGGNMQSYFLESPPFDERGRIGRDHWDLQPGIPGGADDISMRVPRPTFEFRSRTTSGVQTR
jgi:hypothetical protein